MATKEKVKQGKEIKLTKKLEALFKKWGTALRSKETIVRHQMLGKVTRCPPILFAAYETAIKAVYANNSPHSKKIEDWYEHIAGEDGFALPVITAAIDRAKAAEDYHYCAKVINNAGHYYDLLD